MPTISLHLVGRPSRIFSPGCLTCAKVPQISSSKDTATRLLRLANLPFEKSHEHGGSVLLSHLGRINFSNITFAYPTRPHPPVLDSISLSINPHTSTALVGSSGCGKSTIASLLLGLYPPDSGTITFASTPIADLHLPTLRSLISVVPQTPALFAASVALNISYGLPEQSPLATVESIRAAARTAGIDEFIMSLPEGYDTLIGEGGTTMSGGQAQRVAIARAIVRRPELLIPDEATSALDAESARGIYKLVQRLADSRIGCLIITHDLQMMRHCKECVVLGEGGRVLERGPYDKLAGKNGSNMKRLIGV